MKKQTIVDCCNGQRIENPSRRSALKLCTGAIFSFATGASQYSYGSEESDARPESGDFLVRADADGDPTPLRLNDIAIGEKPIIAFPLDPLSKARKSGSRLNKVILLRLTPEEIQEETRGSAADGVLAYSAVCTHQGCDITNYAPKDNALICFCHFTQFRPTNRGEVITGPAPRSLPILPLKLEKDRLVVAGPFSSRPGSTT